MTSTLSSPGTPAPAPPRPKLAPLADEMLTRVTGPGTFTHTKLATGLDVILQRTDALRWRLALAREDDFPSAEEVDAWRALLEAPPPAEPQRTFKRYRHPKSGRVILYYVVELTWLEYNWEGVR